MKVFNHENNISKGCGWFPILGDIQNKLDVFQKHASVETKISSVKAMACVV